MDELAELYYNENLLDELHMVAIPHKVIQYFGGQILLPIPNTDMYDLIRVTRYKRLRSQ